MSGCGKWVEHRKKQHIGTFDQGCSRKETGDKEACDLENFKNGTIKKDERLLRMK